MLIRKESILNHQKLGRATRYRELGPFHPPFPKPRMHDFHARGFPDGLRHAVTKAIITFTGYRTLRVTIASQ